MNDDQILASIKSLKGIKPDKNWAVLTRKRIFTQKEVGHRLTFVEFIKGFTVQYRYVLSAFVLCGLTAGTIIGAQGALPGDVLYPVKRVTEKGVAMISNADQAPEANLRLAEKRLEELNQVTKKNLVQNLPTAVEEYKRAKTEAKKEVSAMVKKNPEQATRIVRKITPQIQEMDNKEKTVLGVLGSGGDALAPDAEDSRSDEVIVGLLIADADKVILTYDKKIDLETVKEYYNDKEYAKALEYYLNSSLNK